MQNRFLNIINDELTCYILNDSIGAKLRKHLRYFRKSIQINIISLCNSKYFDCVIIFFIIYIHRTYK